MARTRRDVWKLPPAKPGDVWSDVVLWYARGVGVLAHRQIADATSWRFLGAMHGIDTALWNDFGYLKPNEPLPSPASQKQFWQQCQHQTWYFLPWHRGYLAAFEAIVLDAIVKLGGPADWALPYWNYSDRSNHNALKLPAAFHEKNLPSGQPNPLFVARRYGDGTGKVVLQPPDVALRAPMLEPHFAGSSTTGASTGFGGPHTRFQHSSRDGSGNGVLERQPHNQIHVLVGGQIAHSDGSDPRNLGLMTNPDTAALDPIFWLHHANIDRLWEVWLKRSAGHQDPADKAWLTGPADRVFAVPKPDGTSHEFAARDVLDTNALGYVYEDISDPLGGADRVATRLERLGVRREILASAGPGVPAMTDEKKTELLGANGAAVQLAGGTVRTQVRMDPTVSRKMLDSFAANRRATGATKEPDRVFLNLENVRGDNDAVAFYVYVNLPHGANPAQHPECLAGAVSLFGVRKATRSDGSHGGNGINETLEITDIVDALHLSNRFDLDHLDVQFVPRTDIKPGDKISVGRVSVYRQGD
jgi:tyrosinase